MSRFEFLQRDFPELYRRCTQAEEATDSDVILLKCRQALEWMVKDLGGQNNNLFFDISELSDKGIIPDNISHMFHDVRMVANRSVHKNETMSQKQVQNCLNQLLELTIWFVVQHDRKYDLSSFASQDVAVARKYMKSAKNNDSYEMQKIEDGVSIDPLDLQEDFAIPEDEPQDILTKDVFETKAEYEQRIADMEPIHIGYGILDMRRKDGYTNVVFLIHHVDKNAKIQFANIDAFFANNVKVDGIVDNELVAKLKVYDGKVCCDYEKVYLRNEEDLIPLKVVKWDKFAYEMDEDYKKRIENLPLIPFGVGYPVRKKYDLELRTLPIMIKAFRYTEKVLEKLLSEDKMLTIPCDKDLAKQLCNAHKKVIIFGKISLPLKWTKYVLWEQSSKVIYEYDLRYIEAKKEIKKRQIEQEKRRRFQRAKEAQARIQQLKKDAEAGNAEAQYHLGDCYYIGKGVEKNYEKAVEWYRKATEQGFTKAQDRLGDCYYFGISVVKNHKKATEWYGKAAKQGDYLGQYNLGDCYYYGKGVEQSYEKAVQWYEKAAEQGFVKAQDRLGDCYYFGIGIVKNHKKAIEWYEKAAKQGSLWAQSTLGNCYYNGKGVEKDYKKAVEWFEKAAKQGNMDAQVNLGDCYYKGNGVEQDYKKAVEWYKKAADQGLEYAKEKLQKLLQ